MSSPDDQAYTGAIERPSRSTIRREILQGRRSNSQNQRNTDLLPSLDGGVLNSKTASRHLLLLREENKRLRNELAEQRAEVQRFSEEYSAAQAGTEHDLVVLQQSHQSEIEQYENHLRDMLAERNQMQEKQRDLEKRYQDLYHSFQNQVEDEAHKMVDEAANTIILAPNRTPALLHNVVKTLELQVRQEEDQQAAQSLYMMRDSQHKVKRLEEELAHERQQIAAERQQLLIMQNSVREQAELRYKTLQARLSGRWTLALTLMTTALLLLLPTFQSVFYYTFHFPLLFSLFAPIVICMLLAFSFARVRSIISPYYTSAPRKGGSPNKK